MEVISLRPYMIIRAEKINENFMQGTSREEHRGHV